MNRSTLILPFLAALALADAVLAQEESPPEVSTLCELISGKLASVTDEECSARAFLDSGGRTVKGSPILYKDFPPLEGRKPLGRVLLVGGIHGDEYSSVSIVFKWLKTLEQYHTGLFHWRIVPLLNPDGLLLPESQRMNANGVDLNRNFPMPEQGEAHSYWVAETDSDPRRYPGEAPLSEPETAWLVEDMANFDPDVIVAVHAPHGVVDYDGPRDGPYKLGRLYLNLLGTFPGSLGNYAGVQRKTPVVTIELPYAGIMPKPSEINEIWKDLVQWLTRNLPEYRQASDTDSQETEPS